MRYYYDAQGSSLLRFQDDDYPLRITSEGETYHKQNGWQPSDVAASRVLGSGDYEVIDEAQAAEVVGNLGGSLEPAPTPTDNSAAPTAPTAVTP